MLDAVIEVQEGTTGIGGAPRIEAVIGAAGGLFPLGLGGEISVHVVAIGLRLIVGDADDGPVAAFEHGIVEVVGKVGRGAALLCHAQCVLRVGHVGGVDPVVAERDSMLGVVGMTVSHDEGAAGNSHERGTIGVEHGRADLHGGGKANGCDGGSGGRGGERNDCWSGRPSAAREEGSEEQQAEEFHGKNYIP